MELKSFKGDSLRVTFMNCTLYLSVKTEGEVPVMFRLEEWILEDNSLVVWAAERLRANSGPFLGLSQEYIEDSLAKISGSGRCDEDFPTR